MTGWLRKLWHRWLDSVWREYDRSSIRANEVEWDWSTAYAADCASAALRREIARLKRNKKKHSHLLAQLNAMEAR